MRKSRFTESQINLLPENSATELVRIRLRMPAGRAPRCAGSGSRKSRSRSRSRVGPRWLLITA